MLQNGIGSLLQMLIGTTLLIGRPAAAALADQVFLLPAIQLTSMETVQEMIPSM